MKMKRLPRTLDLDELKELCDRLNLDHCRRILIDIQVDGAVIIYSEQFLTEEKFDPLIRLLEGKQVMEEECRQ